MIVVAWPMIMLFTVLHDSVNKDSDCISHECFSADELYFRHMSSSFQQNWNDCNVWPEHCALLFWQTNSSYPLVLALTLLVMKRSVGGDCQWQYLLSLIYQRCLTLHQVKGKMHDQINFVSERYLRSRRGEASRSNYVESETKCWTHAAKSRLYSYIHFDINSFLGLLWPMWSQMLSLRIILSNAVAKQIMKGRC